MTDPRAPAPIPRRLFLRYASALAGLAACRPAASTTPPAPAAPPSAKSDPPLAPEPILLGGDKLKILVLGGTGFLGPHLVEAMQKRGHTPTLFNRGKTRPTLFPDVEKLRGDRDGGLAVLEGRRWDAVIDTSGYVPRIVRASAELLAPNVRQYVFVSSISVYTETTSPGVDESHKVATMPDPTSEVVMEFYGALKALCEQAAEAALPDRTTVIRPGLIVGPGDPTDRFSYWPVRVAQGGEVLAPGEPSDPVQVIDVRDLADFILTTLERGHVGVHNVNGPAEPLGYRFADSLRDALPRADYLTVHCPRNAETLGMIGADELALLPRGAAVVNCARGGIVDESALAAALAAGHLSGAGIDVFDAEPPPPDHPLLALPNVFLTPHSAAATREAAWRMATGTPPPTIPEDPDTDWAEAVAWAVASGVVIGVARLVATRRAANYYRRSTGALPKALVRRA